MKKIDQEVKNSKMKVSKGYCQMIMYWYQVLLLKALFY